jgi:hypothetical protein
VYVLRTVNRVVNGPLTKDYDFGDADTIEKTAIILLLLCIFGMGIFPGWIVELVDGSLQPILTSLEQGVTLDGWVMDNSCSHLWVIKPLVSIMPPNGMALIPMMHLCSQLLISTMQPSLDQVQLPLAEVWLY